MLACCLKTGRLSLAARHRLLPSLAHKSVQQILGRGSRRSSSSAAMALDAKKLLWEAAYASEPLAIVKAGDPVLRQAAQAVPPELLGSEELHRLVAAMVDAMRAAPGVGLAAPQVGVPLQVIVLEDRPEYIARLSAADQQAMERSPFGVLALVNPRLEPLGRRGGAGDEGEGGAEGARFFEGCLSVPGYQALVERYRGVQVAALTPEGAPVSLEARGWQARILQHEVDHLQGVLYIDRMLSRSFRSREAAEEGRQLPEGVPGPGPCTCTHRLMI